MGTNLLEDMGLALGAQFRTPFLVDAFEGIKDIALRAKSTSENAIKHIFFNVIFVPVKAG